MKQMNKNANGGMRVKTAAKNHASGSAADVTNFDGVMAI